MSVPVVRVSGVGVGAGTSDSVLIVTASGVGVGAGTRDSVPIVTASGVGAAAGTSDSVPIVTASGVGDAFTGAAAARAWSVTRPTGPPASSRAAISNPDTNDARAGKNLKAESDTRPPIRSGIC